MLIRMAFSGYQWFLGALLLVTALLLTLSTTTLILTIRSQFHTGLDESLCKCELVHRKEDRSIEPRIVNGTAFANRRGLSFVASLYMQAPQARPAPKNCSSNAPDASKATNETFGASNETSRSSNETVVRLVHFCTGIILNNRTILTSTHCFAGNAFNPYVSLGRFWVGAGSDHNLRSIFCTHFFEHPISGERLCDFLAADNYTKKVVRVHMHPNFPVNVFAVKPEKPKTNKTKFDRSKFWNDTARTGMHDVALLEVEPFTLSEELNVLPGCLFESNDRSFGDRLLAAGYGLTESFIMQDERLTANNTNSNETIQIMNKDTRLYTTPLSQTGCEMFMTEEDQVKFKERPPIVCATNSFSAVCNGDSGGPLMYSSDGVKQFIVGVAHAEDKNSTSELFCEHGGTAVYAPVFEHLDWIRSFVGDERCIANALQLEPKKLFPYLQAIFLAILSISLIVHHIQSELKNAMSNLA